MNITQIINIAYKLRKSHLIVHNLLITVSLKKIKIIIFNEIKTKYCFGYLLFLLKQWFSTINYWIEVRRFHIVLSSSLGFNNWIINNKCILNVWPWFDSLAIKYKKLSSSLNISSIKILHGTKLVKNIILHNFCHVTFSQKSILSEIFRIFCFVPLINPPF